MILKKNQIITGEESNFCSAFLFLIYFDHCWVYLQPDIETTQFPLCIYSFIYCNLDHISDLLLSWSIMTMDTIPVSGNMV